MNEAQSKGPIFSTSSQATGSECGYQGVTAGTTQSGGAVVSITRGHRHGNAVQEGHVEQLWQWLHACSLTVTCINLHLYRWLQGGSLAFLLPGPEKGDQVLEQIFLYLK